MKPPQSGPRGLLARLSSRYGIPERGQAQLATLLDLITGDPAAPTTLHDPVRVVHDHIADSLVALELERVRGATVVADLGAGPGFPGLPLAIALPSARVVLVESNARKCEFLARAAAACRLTNVDVAAVRAEEWTEGIGRCDLVVARALAPLPVVAEYAAPLLQIGGSLVAWRGRRDPEDEAAANAAAAELGLAVCPPVHVDPYPGALHRHLHAMVKVGPTPDRFPRRPGMARKRPLGSPSGGRNAKV